MFFLSIFFSFFRFCLPFFIRFSSYCFFPPFFPSLFPFFYLFYFSFFFFFCVFFSLGFSFSSFVFFCVRSSPRPCPFIQNAVNTWYTWIYHSDFKSPVSNSLGQQGAGWQKGHGAASVDFFAGAVFLFLSFFVVFTVGARPHSINCLILLALRFGSLAAVHGIDRPLNQDPGALGPRDSTICLIGRCFSFLFSWKYTTALAGHLNQTRE